VKSILIPFAVLMVPVSVAAQSSNAASSTDRAAEFLVAMQTNASAVRKLATKDAVFVAGDVGGPLSELLRNWSQFRKVFSSCKILEQKTEEVAEVDRKGDEGPSWLLGADPTVIKGTLFCEGSKKAKFAMMTRGGLVSFFGFEWFRDNG
jgi:hypothetical protein